mmetsp:Transcript_19202/g.39164  ORF Transcript_19202/g.39164 Transcript_19202/m.39164 type:complete len:202 (+) Transcript_19202:904-1509(+)
MRLKNTCDTRFATSSSNSNSPSKPLSSSTSSCMSRLESESLSISTSASLFTSSLISMVFCFSSSLHAALHSFRTCSSTALASHTKFWCTTANSSAEIVSHSAKGHTTHSVWNVTGTAFATCSHSSGVSCCHNFPSLLAFGDESCLPSAFLLHRGAVPLRFASIKATTRARTVVSSMCLMQRSRTSWMSQPICFRGLQPRTR